jgi:hypothetical protein
VRSPEKPQVRALSYTCGTRGAVLYTEEVGGSNPSPPATIDGRSEPVPEHRLVSGTALSQEGPRRGQANDVPCMSMAL